MWQWKASGGTWDEAPSKTKAGLRYRARLQRMDENRWVRKVYEWNMYGKWLKDSIKVKMWVGELGMFVRGVMRHGSMEYAKGK